LAPFLFLSSSPIFVSVGKIWWFCFHSTSHQILLVEEFCWLWNFACGSNSLNTLAPFPFLDLIYSLITMYKHNRHWGNTSRNRSHNTNLSMYGPQAGWLCYCDGDNGGGSGGSGGTTRLALRDDDDVATGNALHLGCPVWHVPGELARDSGSMLSGTSLLRGSHHGRNHSGGNGGGTARFALGDDDGLMSPLVMPFIRGILFGMHLVNSQVTQVVCCQEHPCFEGHTMVGIILEAMAAAPQDLL
jgi:hypothetical protein